MNFLNSLSEYVTDNLVAPVQARSDQLIRERQSLLVAMKICAGKVIKTGAQDSESCAVSADSFQCGALISAVERVIFHGIKMREFHGTFPFWGLLQRMVSIYPPIPEFADSTAAVAEACDMLRSPLALSRGWVREALNRRVLAVCMGAIERQPQLGFFYEDGSLLLDPACVKIMIAILRSIEVLQFNLTVFEDELNVSPSWLLVNNSESGKVSKANNKPGRRYSSPADAKSAAIASLAGVSRWDSIYDVIGTQQVAGVLAADSSAYLPQANARRSKHKEVFARTKLFGTSLKELILDDKRCKYALLDSHIGIPRQVHNMISVLHRAIDLPGLFRRRGSREELSVLRDALEAEQDIPAGTQVYTVAHCLLQWLYELPEPILCFEHFDSFLICNTIESLGDRVRNFQLLVDQVSWWQVPLLVQVLNLFATALMPCHSSKNGLSLSAVVVMTTPFLLRSQEFGPICPHHNQAPTAPILSNVEAACMAISVVAGPSVEFLFNHHSSILQEIRATYEHHVAWLEDKLDRLEFVQKFAASRRLQVSDIRAYLDEKGTFTSEIVYNAGDGVAGEARKESASGSKDGQRFYLNSVGVRVVPAEYLANEEVNLVDSLTIVSELWKQLEGAHREMLEKHWNVYVGHLSAIGVAENTQVVTEGSAIPANQSSQDLFQVEDESDDCSDGDSTEGNRLSVAKKRRNHLKHVSSGIASADDADDFGGSYAHVRDEIDGMVRMSQSEGNLQEIGGSQGGSLDEESDDDETPVKCRDRDRNPAGKYDGEDEKLAKFHNIVPAVVLETEKKSRRRGSESSEDIEYSDPDLIIVKEKKADDSMGGPGVDAGWGERGKRFSGMSVLAKGNSFFSASTRDAVRFEAYSHGADDEEVNKDRVDAAVEWKSKAIDAPVVFPAYNIEKILVPASIEAYRWSICGFAGCLSNSDKAVSANVERQEGDSHPLEGSGAQAVSWSTSTIDAPQRSASPILLQRHGNHQRPIRSHSAHTARREEPEQPLQVFEEHEFGSMAAELLLRFLQRFGHRADAIVCEFARKRIKYCSLSLVCCRLTQIILWVLRLVPSSKPSHHSYGMRSAASNNNVSELGSFFRESCLTSVAAENTVCRNALPTDGISNVDVSSHDKSSYEPKIFECSNTYNVIEAEPDNREAPESKTMANESMPSSGKAADFDLILDDPLDLDIEETMEKATDVGSTECWESEVGNESGAVDESDDFFNPDGLSEFPSYTSPYRSDINVSPNSAPLSTQQILHPKMLAQEPSWALLSSEKCIQEVFDVALLMFDDIWKYSEATEACGIHYDSENSPEYTNNIGSLKDLLQNYAANGSSPLHFDPLNFCLDVVKSLMSELIDMKLMSVDQLWNQWTLLRMSRQELVFESKLLLKLSRLSILRQSIESAEDGFSQSKLGTSKFSVLATLSSLLSPSGDRSGLPQSRSATNLSEKANSQSASEKETTTMLFQTQNEMYAQSKGEDRPPTPPLHIFGDSNILTTRQLKELRHKLPEQYKFADWHLRYRMSSDGASLTTMLKLSPDDDTKLLILLNSAGDVFGALITESWSKKLNHHFYGTGTCTVWSFYQKEDLQMYLGTGSNDYYILVCDQYFAMGSGGNFAIYLDSDLSNGCSGPCETYGSPSLCTSEEFSCVACELFALQSNI